MRHLMAPSYDPSLLTTQSETLHFLVSIPGMTAIAHHACSPSPGPTTLRSAKPRCDWQCDWQMDCEEVERNVSRRLAAWIDSDGITQAWRDRAAHCRPVGVDEIQASAAVRSPCQPASAQGKRRSPHFRLLSGACSFLLLILRPLFRPAARNAIRISATGCW